MEGLILAYLVIGLIVDGLFIWANVNHITPTGCGCLLIFLFFLITLVAWPIVVLLLYLFRNSGKG